MPVHNNLTETFDAAIIGGGLAGLSLSILLAKAGYKPVVFEKERYPFHKVCGEYVGMESRDFIERLGVDIRAMHLPVIKKLIVSSPDGHCIRAPLDPGGFGASRYLLDTRLKEVAIENGVVVCEGTKINDVRFGREVFSLEHDGTETKATIVAGCFGKRSNLDVKWKRGFIAQSNRKLNHFIGVKYHVKAHMADDTIALHNFKNGYCGISAIEGGRCCLCYLTNAQNLHASQNSIREMEANILFRNPHIQKLFSEAEFLFERPVTIAQISFEQKSQIENHVLMLGDATGMIAPLCGNGMSMALHSATIAFAAINRFLKKQTTRIQMETQYAAEWNSQFSNRLRNGRVLQYFFGKELLTNLFVRSVKPFPFLIRKMINATHGKAF